MASAAAEEDVMTTPTLTFGLNSTTDGIGRLGSLPANQAAQTVTRTVTAGEAAIGSRVAFPQSACLPDKKKTLGLWKIPEDKSPISSAATNRVSDEILSRAVKLKPACIDPMDGAGSHRRGG